MPYVPGQVYADNSDVTTIGLPPKALVDVPINTVTMALQFASDEVTSSIQQYRPPLITWGGDIKMATIALARLWILEFRGFNPTDPAAKSIVNAAMFWRDWLGEVAKGDRTPTNIVGTPITAGLVNPTESPAIISATPQGWGTTGFPPNGYPQSGYYGGGYPPFRWW